MSLPNCPMPPKLASDEARELLKDASDVAQIIFDDMHKMSSLSDQQSKLGCGELLQKALPLGTLDREVNGRPVFLTELLPFEGDYSSLSSLLSKSSSVHMQKRQAVAVTQASGSGKTKLAYAHGLEQGLMVLIRVVRQHSDDEKEIKFSGPWIDFLQLCDDLKASLSPSNKLAYAQSALTALRLVAIAYVLWVTIVLQEYASISAPESETRKAPARDSPQAAWYREAALRCLRNGRGDEAVAKIYSKLLVAFKDLSSPASTAGVIPRPAMDGVTEYFHALNRYLRSELLWPQAEIALWYDEAQMLLENGHVFMSLTEFEHIAPNTIATPSATDDAGAIPKALTSPKDAMYGLTALMTWLSDNVGWDQVICGPWLELSNRVKLPEFSCLNGRVASLHHASRITLTDMTTSINRFFKVEVPEPTRTLLAKLEGRPKWFFDNFWPSLWVKLRGYWVTLIEPLSNLSPALLNEFIKKSAIEAVAASEQAATRLVQTRWSDKLEGEQGVPSSSALCRELYAAIKMNLGIVTVSGGDATADAVKYGLLALEPKIAGTDTILSQEPVMATALEEYGDHVVAEASNLKKLDPVELLLKRKLSDGKVAQFDMTTSVKGPVFELCFVWHVIKTRLVMKAAPTLEDIFDGLLPSTFRLPDHVAGLVATASKAVSSKTIREISDIKTDFHVFFEGEHTNYLIYNVDRFAGMDVGFPAAEDGDLTKRILVSVQLKTQPLPSLVDCLRAATPAWQYVQVPLREAIIRNSWPNDKRLVSSVKRKHFEALARDHSEFFDRSVRVAMTAIEFRPESVSVCNELNNTDCFDSPIVLSAITDDCAFPLAKMVRATVVKDYAASQVAHTEQWQYWQSYSVAEIANAISTAGTVTTPLSETAKTALRKLHPIAKRRREFVPDDRGDTAAKVPRIDGTNDESEHSAGEQSAAYTE